MSLHCNIKPRGICKQTMPALFTCSPRSHTNIGFWENEISMGSGVITWPNYWRSFNWNLSSEVWRLKHIDFIQADPAYGVRFEHHLTFLQFHLTFLSPDTSPFWEAVCVWCVCVCGVCVCVCVWCVLWCVCVCVWCVCVWERVGVVCVGCVCACVCVRVRGWCACRVRAC